MRGLHIVIGLIGTGIAALATPAVSQTLPQPTIIVVSDAEPVVARPTPKIIRMPWQTGIFQ